MCNNAEKTNDSYEHTPEVDAAIQLLSAVVSANQVDTPRIYSTGQSMGGMISMYYDYAYPVNLLMFTPGSVLPADGKGSEHMYSFDYAYKVKSVREWLFRQHK